MDHLFGYQLGHMLEKVEKLWSKCS